MKNDFAWTTCIYCDSDKTCCALHGIDILTYEGGLPEGSDDDANCVADVVGDCDFFKEQQ